MDHDTRSHSSVVADSTMMGGMKDQDQGGILDDHHGSPHNMPQFFDGMSEREESQLLEMLHVPILHGGVNEVLLLSSLSTASAGSFALACLLLVVCVALLELLRLLAWWVENQYSGGNSKKSPVCECKQCNSLTATVGERKQYDAIHDSSLAMDESSTADLDTPVHPPASRWMAWACVGGLQFLLYLFSTFLMLIAMTMNIYLIVSMAFGAMIGKMIVVCVKAKLLDARK